MPRDRERDREEQDEPSVVGKVGKVTWLTPFYDTWKAKLGQPPAGRLAKALKPVVGELGAPETLDRWNRYLADTEPKFCSPEGFAARHAAYAGPEVQEMTNDFGVMQMHRKDRESGQWVPVVA